VGSLSVGNCTSGTEGNATIYCDASSTFNITTLSINCATTQPQNSSSVIVGVTVGSLLFLLCLLLAVLLCWRRRTTKHSKADDLLQERMPEPWIFGSSSATYAQAYEYPPSYFFKSSPSARASNDDIIEVFKRKYKYFFTLK